MNKQIRELMELAMVPEDPNSLEGDFGLHRLDGEKFTHLIVERCIAQIMEVGDDYFKARLDALNFEEKNRLNTGERACRQSIQKITNLFVFDKYDF